MTSVIFTWSAGLLSVFAVLGGLCKVLVLLSRMLQQHKGMAKSLTDVATSVRQLENSHSLLVQDVAELRTSLPKIRRRLRRVEDELGLRRARLVSNVPIPLPVTVESENTP